VYIEIEEYEEVDQEMTLFINEFLSKIESPLIKQDELLQTTTIPSEKLQAPGGLSYLSWGFSEHREG